MKALRVRLPPLGELGADSALDFEIIDGDRRVLERGIAVPAALPRLPRVELIIAAPDVLLLDAALPRLSGAKLRAALPGMEPKRADVILAGAILVVEAMRAAGFDRLTVSDRGVRWGLLHDRVHAG